MPSVNAHNGLHTMHPFLNEVAASLGPTNNKYFDNFGDKILTFTPKKNQEPTDHQKNGPTRHTSYFNTTLYGQEIQLFKCFRYTENNDKTNCFCQFFLNEILWNKSPPQGQVFDAQSFARLQALDGMMDKHIPYTQLKVLQSEIEKFTHAQQHAFFARQPFQIIQEEFTRYLLSAIKRQIEQIEQMRVTNRTSTLSRGCIEVCAILTYPNNDISHVDEKSSSADETLVTNVEVANKLIEFARKYLKKSLKIKGHSASHSLELDPSRFLVNIRNCIWDSRGRVVLPYH